MVARTLDPLRKAWTLNSVSGKKSDSTRASPACISDPPKTPTRDPSYRLSTPNKSPSSQPNQPRAALSGLERCTTVPTGWVRLRVTVRLQKRRFDMRQLRNFKHQLSQYARLYTPSTTTATGSNGILFFESPTPKRVLLYQGFRFLFMWIFILVWMDSPEGAGPCGVNCLVPRSCLCSYQSPARPYNGLHASRRHVGELF